MPAYVDPPENPKNNPSTVEGVELGRQLFYEKLLSRDNTFSCNTCHKQEFAFSEHRKVAVGIDSLKLTVNTMALTNVGLGGKFFWDGRGKSLEKQALAPVVNHMEMDQRFSATVMKLSSTKKYPDLFYKAFGSREITPLKIAAAISQFERTMLSFNSKYDKFLRNEIELSPIELEGMNLFFTSPDPASGIRGGACSKCHLPITFAGPPEGFQGFKNNGLDKVHYKNQGRERITHKKNDFGKFKVPSLRNVEITYPYMHDGRFESLEEVVDHYSEGIKNSATLDPILRNSTNDPMNGTLGLHLSPHEKKAIICFLKTLTDSTFLTNKSLSKPL